MSLLGSRFTYFSSGPSAARSRLEHFLISCGVGGWSHDVTQRAVLRLVSDHIPIVMSNGRMFLQPRPFKFFNSWRNDTELRRLVSDSWYKLDYVFSSFWFKFSCLWAKVRTWQTARYSISVIMSKECESELSSLLSGPIPQTSDELESFTLKKKELSIELQHLRSLEDQCWY